MSRGAGAGARPDRATSGTPSCATTPTRAWSTPCAGRSCPASSGCGTAWASACSTRSMCLLRTGEWDRAAAMVEAAVEDDDLGDFVDPARAAAVVRALRGDGEAAREVLPVDEGVGRGPCRTWRTTRTPAPWCATPKATPPRPSRHARRAAEVAPGPDDGPLRPRLAPRRPLGARAGDRAALDEVLALLDGRYDGEIPLLVRAERRLAMARLVAGPRGAGGRDRGRRDGPAGGRARRTTWRSPCSTSRRPSMLAGKDPSDVIAEAATIGATLGSPQVVERAESLRPRRPGDARTAP